MPKNLEIKVKLNSHRLIKTILAYNGINQNDLLIQKDIYYKTNRGILKLRLENNSQTLIFYNRNEQSKKRWSDYHLMDIINTDANKYLKRFLDVLVVVSKKRSLYIYKNTRIHLDFVKELGYFLELETRVVNGLKDAEKRFNYLIKLLNLKSYPEIRASYKDLLSAKKQNDIIKK